MFVAVPYSSPEYLEKRIIPRQRALFSAAARIEGDIARHFLAAIQALQGKVPLGELARILPGASTKEVYRILGVDGIQVVASALTEELSKGLVVGSALAAKELGQTVVLDLLRPRVQEWLKNHSIELVKEIGKGSRAGIRVVLKEGIMRGRHPTKIARDLKRSLGLLERHSNAVENYFFKLMGDGVPELKAARRSEKYADRLRKYRARNVARTESMTAINRGRLQLWQQLIDDGALAETVVQEWLTAADERVCDICSPLNHTRAPVGGTFEGGFESPPAHPSCRCTTVLIEHPRRRR